MEVRNSFLTNLIEYYSNRQSREINSLTNKLLEQMKSKEAYYHSMILMLMRVTGFEVEGEVHTDKGRIDAVLKKEKENDIIVVEIKYSADKSKEEMIKEAIKQIKEKKYYEKYDRKEVSLLAIAFSNKKEIGCKFEKECKT
ncbi:MAG: PD-(D/E)XK nuclease domain-containing protein [Endomicrobium sp.]|jgi:glycerophosphoryl diester phosphodiesterase|nr:PD-(D/E)XK nuclease domain-containing protein [Endomicrobium sp.]